MKAFYRVLGAVLFLGGQTIASSVRGSEPAVVQDSYTYAIDPVCSSQFAHLFIRSCTAALTKQKVLQKQVRYLTLRYPVIETIIVKEDKRGAHVVQVALQAPAVVVNNAHVLTAQAGYVHCSYFSPAALELLPHIQCKVAMSSQLIKRLLLFFSRFEKSILPDFTVIVQDQGYKVVLSSVQYSYSVIVTCEMAVTSALIAQAQELIADMKRTAISQKKKVNKNDTQYVVDMRFLGHHVVYKI